MSKQSKELKKQFIKLIEDIFDNYDKYSDSEKVAIKNQLIKIQNINSILEKYDTKSKSIWDTIMGWFDNATGKK